MIKKTFWLFSLVMALMLYLFWQGDNASPDDKNTIKSINQVSLQTGHEAKETTTEGIKKQLKQKSAKVSEFTKNVEQVTSGGNGDWSYLAIYRRLEWADVCGRYFWFVYRNKDNPSADFVADFSKNDHSEQQDNELDPRAVAGLNRYQSRCEALQKAVFAYAQVDEMEGYKANSVVAELQTLLETTPAKTKKEERIKAHAEITKAFYQARRTLSEVKRQNNTISSTEQSRIYDEMQSLNMEIEALGDGLDSEAALESYDYLVSEIIRLDDRLIQQYDTESEAYQVAWSNLLQLWIEVQSRLIGDDPDVFKMVKLASEWSSHISSFGMSISLYRKKMGFPLKSPGEQMMESFGVQAEHAFAEAANPAAVLYLCGLGYDCGSEGSLAMQLCMMHYQDMPAACEVSVQDFYLNHALSPHLLEDVLSLYQWMEHNYGS